MTSLIILLITVAGTAVAAFASIETVWHKKGLKRNLAIVAGVLAVLGALANGVYAIVASRAQSVAETARNVKQDQMADVQKDLRNTQKELRDAQNELRIKSDRVIALTQDNHKANELIFQQGSALLNQTTGGNNWAKATLFFDAVNRDLFVIWLENNGDYRLPNLQIVLYDCAKLTRMIPAGGRQVQPLLGQIIKVPDGRATTPSHSKVIHGQRSPCR